MVVQKNLASYRLVLAGTKKQQPYEACSGVTLAGIKFAARGRPLRCGEVSSKKGCGAPAAKMALHQEADVKLKPRKK